MPTPLHPAAADIVQFWRAAGPQAWFRKDAAFDAALRQRFEKLHMAAARREHDDWLAHADGALALMVLLDQFPRNCYRGTAHSYATDPLARHLADRAIAAGLDQALPTSERVFLYLPFEHSEDMADQQRAVQLIRAHAPESLEWAELHLDIIRRFGRFPHRNAALGRVTTPEEQAFLDGGGFAG